jgi:hypothetical protein
MDAEQLIVYFNNCHNRDHVALFGSGAFLTLALREGKAPKRGTSTPVSPV